MHYHDYYVYLLTNKHRTVLYVGVTNDLIRRLGEHHAQAGRRRTFTGRYQCHFLIYWEHLQPRRLR
ncbi:MAG: GIY-YIG nuclease family protein [Catalinimonas sp.]